MGSLCCCFQVPDVEETVDSNSFHHGNCMCPNCFIQKFKNKYGAFFGRQLPNSVDSQRHNAQISGHVYPASEDEDVCPTCLEEYTPENPKITTQCCHNYHLSCIYEWMERSEKCPICSKLMVFDETT